MSAAALAVELGRALAAQALDGPVLRAGGHAQALAARQRGDLDLRAAQGLGDRERDLDLEVLALALEDRGVGDVGDHEEVALRPAAAARLALAGQADAAALAHSRGDVDLVLLDRARGARALAGRARVVDDRAAALALRARLGDREEALPLRLDAAALAARAHLGRGAGLGAGAAARPAGLGHRHLQRDLRALDRLLEAQRDLGLEVAAALGARSRGARRASSRTPRPAPPAAAAEQVGEDVRERARVEAAARAAGARRPGAAGERVEPAAVVLLALLRVAEHVVGVLDLLEALLGLGVAGVAVGVVLAHELAVRLLDLLRRRLLVDAEDLVEVRRHRSSYAATTTRAGRITVSAIR